MYVSKERQRKIKNREKRAREKNESESTIYYDKQ